MGDLDISRPLTEAERQDTVEIGRVGVLDTFLAKLAKKQQEYQVTYRPFDTYGARCDFDEKVKKLSVDLNTAVDISKVDRKMDISNLDKYGSQDRFELEGVRDVVEDKLLDGIRQSVKTGKEYRFRTKVRGNLVIVFVPLTEVEGMDAWLDKDKKKVKNN